LKKSNKFVVHQALNGKAKWICSAGKWKQTSQGCDVNV